MTQPKSKNPSESIGDKEASHGYSPQYPMSPFTAFKSVTPSTALESLNLNWREQDLLERIRTKHVHRLHPYLGKFIPQLVEIIKECQLCHMHWKMNLVT